jgi:predicted kinase
MADNLGRVGLNLPTQLENLELLKEYALEYNCLDQPYKFKSELAKFRYFNVEPNIHYDPYDDRKFIVHMIVGLPGSGKDFFIKKELSHLPEVSLDKIREELKIKPTENQGRVIQAAKEKAKEYMRTESDFVYNATNITRLIREPLIDLFYSYGGYITIWHVATPIKTILQQNKQRDAVVPENVINKLRMKYDIPTLTEAHSVFRVSGFKS